MIIILLALFLTSLQVGAGDDWPGIDPCKGPIACVGILWNINVSNPEDCSQYFTCMDVWLYPQQCPTGLQFDQNILICTAAAACQSQCPSGEYDYKAYIFHRSSPSTADSLTSSVVPKTTTNQITRTTSLLSTVETKTSWKMSFSSLTDLTSSVTQTTATPSRSPYRPTTSDLDISSTDSSTRESTRRTSLLLTTEAMTSSQTSYLTTSKFNLPATTTTAATSIKTSGRLPSTQMFHSSPSGRDSSTTESTESTSSFKSHTSGATSSMSTQSLSTAQSDSTVTVATSQLVSTNNSTNTSETAHSLRETTSWKLTTTPFATIKPNETVFIQTTTSAKIPTTKLSFTTTTATSATSASDTTTNNIHSTKTTTPSVSPSSSSPSFSTSSSSSTSLSSSSPSSQYSTSFSSSSSRISSSSSSPSSSSSSQVATSSSAPLSTTIKPLPISSAPTSNTKQTTTTEQSTSSQKVTTSARSPVTTMPTTATTTAITSQVAIFTTSLAPPNTSTATYTTEVETGKITNPTSFTASIANNRQMTSTGKTSQQTTSAGETSQQITSAGKASQQTTSAGETSQQTTLAGKTSQRTTSAGETSKWTTGETSQWTIPETSTSSPTALSTEPDIVTTTDFRPADLSTLCNRQLPCVVGDRFGDVADCTRYFECVTLLGTKNYWLSMGCSNDRLFDPIQQQCTGGNSGRCLQNICSPKFEHKLVNTSWPALSNRPLKFLCSFRVVFVIQPIAVKGISWTLNGYAVTSSGTDQRIQVEGMVSVDRDIYSSTLSFNPVTIRDSGFVECIVEYGNGLTSRQAENFRVLPTPSVDLSPLNEVVMKNESVVLRCNANFDDPSIGNPISGNSSNDAFDDLHMDIVWYKDNEKINLTNDVNCTVDGNFNVSVLTCQPQNDTSFFCRTNFKYGFTDSQPCSVKVIQDNDFTCNSEVVDDIKWPQTLANTTSMVSCKTSSVGFVTRLCSISGWEASNSEGCIDKELISLLSQARDVRQGISINSSYATESIATAVSSFLSTSEEGMTFGNFNTSLTILQELGSIHSTAWNITKPSPTEIKSVLWSVSWLLNSTNDPQWRKLITRDSFGAVPVMDIVNVYGRKWAKGLSPESSEVVSFEYLTVSTTCVYRNRTKNISVPQKNLSTSDVNEGDWIRISKDGIFFQNPLEYQNGDGNSLYYVSSSYYRNLDSYLPRSGPEYGHLSNETLGSRIISLTVDGLPSTSNLSIPVRIVLENTATSIGKLKRNCVFWNPTSKPSGSWSDVGCRNVTGDESSEVTVCECDHLTNFAILFSPNPTDDVILSIISIIGCIISVVSLCLTLLLFGVRWKKIRSHHIVVLINLCIALIIANLIFLVGVNRTTNKVACTVIAALLHYFFLAAFFIMLIEGIQLLLYIVCPLHFHRKRETTLLLLSGWILPMVVVGVSLGVTKTEGYGGPETCWLSLSNGLLWAFVGPALAVILVNFVILVIVLVSIARTKRAIEQTKKQRIWATAWNVFMITPVLGVTWVFGVFSVNQELVVFQYIFAIFNSLQGFFIFLFHGLCYRKRDGKSEDVTCNPPVEQYQQTQERRPSYIRRPSRNKTARIENQKRRLQRHAINWVAIAAAAVASSADQFDLQEFDDESSSGGGRDEGQHVYDEETFSRSLQPSAVNSIRSVSHNTTSTNRTDLLF